MCKVSAQLKFCTCSGDVIDKNAYWTLYRYHADQDLVVMGDLILPNQLDPATDNFNREVLLHRINEKDAWDFDLNPAQNDRLAVTLSCKGGHITYGFEFDGVNWKECEFDPFEWLSKHEQDESGEVNPAITKK